jgi:hypothetical protein
VARGLVVAEQSILSFAVSEELVEYNAAASVTKPRYERAREPHIFVPADVEAIRVKLGDLRDRTLVSTLGYSGPRPEEVVCRLTWNDVGEQAIRYVDTKRHRTRHTPPLKPLKDDLTEWFVASGRPTGNRPVFPAHDGGFWAADDWRNWRRRTWQGEPERQRRDRKNPNPARPGAARRAAAPARERTQTDGALPTPDLARSRLHPVRPQAANLMFMLMASLRTRQPDCHLKQAVRESAQVRVKVWPVVVSAHRFANAAASVSTAPIR